jgi:glycerophosphoryl diester phosphodiesterase
MTRGVQVIAHRGASRAERENTLVAFRRAVAMGADAVELDVRVSADGALVVHHDPVLADGSRISALTRDQLPPQVPTLTEALDSVRELWVNVEIKNSPGEPDHDPQAAVADATIALLRDRDEPERFLVSCFDLATIDRCHRLAPEIATAFLSVSVPDGAVAQLAAAGHRAFHPWDPTVTAELIDRCHAAGLALNTWTCDDPVRMAELIGWGIDGICTNVARHRRRRARTLAQPLIPAPPAAGAGNTRRTASGSWVNSRCVVSPR